MIIKLNGNIEIETRCNNAQGVVLDTIIKNKENSKKFSVEVGNTMKDFNCAEIESVTFKF